MAGGGIVFIFGIFVVLIIAGAFYSIIAARKRREGVTMGEANQPPGGEQA